MYNDVQQVKGMIMKYQLTIIDVDGRIKWSIIYATLDAAVCEGKHYLSLDYHIEIISNKID